MFAWWEVWLTLNRLKPMAWQSSTTSVRAEHLCLDCGAGWGKLSINLLFLLSSGPEHQVSLTLHMCGSYRMNTRSLILPLMVSLTCEGHRCSVERETEHSPRRIPQQALCLSVLQSFPRSDPELSVITDFCCFRAVLLLALSCVSLAPVLTMAGHLHKQQQNIRGRISKKVLFQDVWSALCPWRIASTVATLGSFLVRNQVGV